MMKQSELSRAARLLEFLWESGLQPQLEDVIESSEQVELDELVCLVRIDQQRRFERGEAAQVEQYIKRFPHLATDPERLTDLVYGEFLARREFLEPPGINELATRFPQVADKVQLQIAFHRAMLDFVAAETNSESEHAANHASILECFADLPGYDNLQMLSYGGMSVVLSARHRALNRSVAIKVLVADQWVSNEAKQRFLHEIEVVARLRHPHIVEVHDAGQHRGRLFLVMELMAGGTLVTHFRGRPCPVPDVIEFMTKVGRAVEHCHRQGIVHRDLKPGNILLAPETNGPGDVDRAGAGERLGDWVPKVADFGLSKLQLEAADDKQTQTGSVIGTPAYMSPEQARGDTRHIGPASDIYSLGSILYELLTGRPPFQGNTQIHVLQQVVADPPIPPSRLHRGLSRSIETICLKCLEKVPGHRYASCQELVEDLENCLHHRPIRARRAGPVARLINWSARHSTWATVIAFVCLMGIAAPLGLWWHLGSLAQSHSDQLVHSLTSLETTQLWPVVNELATDPSRARLSFSKLAAAPHDDRPSFNVEFARRFFDANSTSQLESLIYLSTPAELELVCRFVPLLSADEIAELRQELKNPDARPDRRLRAACVCAHATCLERDKANEMLPKTSTETHRERMSQLVALSQRSLRDMELPARSAADDAVTDNDQAPTARADVPWNSIASELLRPALQQSMFNVKSWTNLLWPLRLSMRDAWREVISSATELPQHRIFAMTMLTEHFATNTDYLISLIPVCQLDVYPTLQSAIVANREDARNALRKIWDSRVPIVAPGDVDAEHPTALQYQSEMIRRAQYDTSIAAALALTGDDGPLRSLLVDRLNPTSRTFAIENLATLLVPWEWLIQNCRQSDDAAELYASILALGQYELTSSNKQQIAAVLQERCRDMIDPAVLGGLEWLGRKWRLDSIVELSLPKQQDSHASAWINSQGQAFVTLTLAECMLGSPTWEEEHEPDEKLWHNKDSYTYSIARHEVTIEEFSKYRSEFRSNPRYYTSARCPVNGVNFYAAASYCRWLSEQEGIAEDQMCFPPAAQIAPDMQLPADYLSRTGYRLPTEAEWEFACRAGSTSSWSFGWDSSYAAAYANCLPHSNNRSTEVGTLKPNCLGLFDMHGNIAEWLINAYEVSPVQRNQITTEELRVDPKVMRQTRGGYFGDIKPSIRSARNYAHVPKDGWTKLGFRIARTVSSEARQISSPAK